MYTVFCTARGSETRGRVKSAISDLVRATVRNWGTMNCVCHLQINTTEDKKTLKRFRLIGACSSASIMSEIRRSFVMVTACVLEKNSSDAKTIIPTKNAISLLKAQLESSERLANRQQNIQVKPCIFLGFCSYGLSQPLQRLQPRLGRIQTSRAAQ